MVAVLDPCRPSAIAVADDASPDERQSIVEAAALWAMAGGPIIALQEGAIAADLTVGFQNAAPLFHGLYRSELRDILINRTITDPRARAITVAHELGHGFGLVHVSDRPSLMNPGNATVPPQRHDARAIAGWPAGCAAPPVATAGTSDASSADAMDVP